MVSMAEPFSFAPIVAAPESVTLNVPCRTVMFAEIRLLSASAIAIALPPLNTRLVSGATTSGIEVVLGTVLDGAPSA